MGILADKAVPYYFSNPQTYFKLRHLLQEAEEDAWDLDPPYQREACWTDEQQRAFLAHLLTGGAFPPLIVNRFFSPTRNKNGYEAEVLDGKQRLLALRRWAANDLEVYLHGRGWRACDCDHKDQRLIQPLVRFCEYRSLAERASLYVRLNSGTAHTPADLEKARRVVAAAAVAAAAARPAPDQSGKAERLNNAVAATHSAYRALETARAVSATAMTGEHFDGLVAEDAEDTAVDAYGAAAEALAAVATEHGGPEALAALETLFDEKGRCPAPRAVAAALASIGGTRAAELRAGLQRAVRVRV